MRILPFTIPTAKNQSFHIQKDSFENFYPYLHRHPEIQITHISKGRGILLAKNEVFRFEPGSIFVIASNVSHLFKNEKTKEGIESLSVFFRCQPNHNPVMAIPELEKLSKYYSQLIFCQQLEGELVFKTQNKLSAIAEASKVESLGYFIELISLLYRRIVISEVELDTYSEKDGDLMKIIFTYTLKNLDQDISITEAAAKIGYTPEAFCRFFKKRTYKTYIRFVNELRIDRACHLLIENNYTVKEIAFRSGFNNVSHFNRMFRQIKESNPLEYRKKYLAKFSEP